MHNSEKAMVRVSIFFKVFAVYTSELIMAFTTTRKKRKFSEISDNPSYHGVNQYNYNTNIIPAIDDNHDDDIPYENKIVFGYIHCHYPKTFSYDIAKLIFLYYSNSNEIKQQFPSHLCDISPHNILSST